MLSSGGCTNATSFDKSPVVLVAADEAAVDPKSPDILAFFCSCEFRDQAVVAKDPSEGSGESV